MKRLLLISVLLAFLGAPPAGNALTVENIAVSATGGIVVAGGASASGSTSADTGVKSIIRSEGTNTHVRIDISTSVDGDAEATTSERTLQNVVGEGRFEVRVPSDENAEAHVASDVSASSTATSTPSFFQAWANFKTTFIKIYRLLFFWE